MMPPCLSAAGKNRAMRPSKRSSSRSFVRSGSERAVARSSNPFSCRKVTSPPLEPIYQQDCLSLILLLLMMTTMVLLIRGFKGLTRAPANAARPVSMSSVLLLQQAMLYRAAIFSPALGVGGLSLIGATGEAQTAVVRASPLQRTLECSRDPNPTCSA